MRFSILALAASASAWTFTAYSGNDCTGDAGSAIETKPPGQTVCSNVNGRPSFKLTKGDTDTSPSIDLTYYNGNNCGQQVLSKQNGLAAGCYAFPAGTLSAAFQAE